MLSSLHSLVVFLTLITLACAAPLNHVHKKREIVTRVHTASTTNTVTDFFTTTTRVVIAPTVEFIISNGVTLTTTLPLLDGSVPTDAPSTTITSTFNDRGAEPAVPTEAVQQSQETNANNETPTETSTSTSTTVPAVSTDVVSGNSGQNSGDSDSGNGNSGSNNSGSNNSGSNNSGSNNSGSNNSGSNNSGSSNSGSSNSGSNNSGNNNSGSNNSGDNTSSDNGSGNNSDNGSSGNDSASSDNSTPAGSGSGVPNAIVYSPYNDDSSCKDASTVYSDMSNIKSKGINNIRVYGTDCNSLQTIQPAAAGLGMKVNQGFWIGGSGVDSIDSSVSDVISYGQSNGWDLFEYITIGNEAIISGFCSVDDLISKISSVKSQLRSAGYNGPVTTAEPPVIFQSHPNLCTNADIDFVSINSHPYFDPNSDASSAGTFVKGQLQMIKKVCGTDNVKVTETGYPSKGVQHGGNIPSKQNQIIAVDAIISELNGDCTILSASNDLWKNPGPYGIEQSFGVLDFLK